MNTSPDDQCDYCGLPLPRRLARRRPAGDSASRFCCTGCRFSFEVVRERGEAGAAGWTLMSLGLSIFFTMSVMVFTIAHWMYGVYDLSGPAGTPLSVAFGQLLQWLALLFTVPVLLLLGRPLIEDSLAALRSCVLSTDLLLLTGVGAAFVASTWSVLRGHGPVYYEVTCMILVAVTIGRWMSATGRLRVNEALDGLVRLLPERVLRLERGEFEETDLDALRIGDLVSVRAGDRIPVDGRIELGDASIDEQVFTGESAPVSRRVGDNLHAGTLNLDGTLWIRASALPRQGAFGALVEAVRSAREDRGPWQTLADRVSSAFFPVIGLLALTAAAAHGFSRGWSAGLLAGLSVLLIACPCGLALAAPLAVWASLGRAARLGILFRSGEALERLAAVTAVRFDKTGTITTGAPQVVMLHVAANVASAEIAERAQRLASESSHAFSRAIQRTFRSRRLARGPLTVRTVPAQGVEADWPGESEPVRLGQWRWLVDAGCVLEPHLGDQLRSAAIAGSSLVAIAWQSRIQGVFIIEEQLRRDAVETLARLRDDGLDLGLLTGDHALRAARLSQELGIPVQSGLTPQAKADAIRSLQGVGQVVAMVGDGLNDAPALSTADVGIALGCGADVTRDSADVCLLSSRLRTLVDAIDLSRDTVRTIRGNLLWSFGYNTVGVALAMGGLLHPSIAALLMVVSSGVVISRSVRLAGREPESKSALNSTSTGEQGMSMQDQASPSSAPAAEPLRGPAVLEGVA
ncbi:MAG: cation-translocating P-type ATPase [Planctomyces sp.]|nr:cation-translocating P-type ATPase [Planctomyces sp.]